MVLFGRSARTSRLESGAVWREYDTERKNLNAPWLSKPTAKSDKFDVTPEPRGRKAARGRPPLCHSEACGEAAALRPAARARRRDEELGGDARPEPRSRRKAACRPRRGSPGRIQRIRGHDPARRIWRRHRDDLGSRDAGRPKAIRTRATPKATSSSISTARSCTAAGIWCACARRESDRHDNWLLIKGKDEEARGPRDKDILEEEPRSVVTGRSIEEIAAGRAKKRVWHSNRAQRPARSDDAKTSRNPQPSKESCARRGARAKAEAAERKPALNRGRANGEPSRRCANAAGPAKRAALPDFVPLEPRRRSTSSAPSGPDWLHEIKFDGYRMEARLDHGKVQLADAQAAGLDAPLQAGRRRRSPRCRPRPRCSTAKSSSRTNAASAVSRCCRPI